MLIQASDRALGRVVARLAGARPDDVEAILSELSPRHRLLIEGLLKDYRGLAPREVRASTGSPAVAPFDIEGVAPWLAERLQTSAEPAAGGIDSNPLGMTPAAVWALQASAEEMLSLGLAVPRRPDPAPARSALRRLIGRLAQGGAAG